MTESGGTKDDLRLPTDEPLLTQVSAALMFDAGILSCLQYLESVPWSDDEEERVISCLSHLQLRCPMIDELLRRVLPEPSTSTSFTNVFVQLLTRRVATIKQFRI